MTRMGMTIKYNLKKIYKLFNLKNISEQGLEEAKLNSIPLLLQMNFLTSFHRIIKYKIIHIYNMQCFKNHVKDARVLLKNSSKP